MSSLFQNLLNIYFKSYVRIYTRSFKVYFILIPCTYKNCIFHCCRVGYLVEYVLGLYPVPDLSWSNLKSFYFILDGIKAICIE